MRIGSALTMVTKIFRAARNLFCFAPALRFLLGFFLKLDWPLLDHVDFAGNRPWKLTVENFNDSAHPRINRTFVIKGANCVDLELKRVLESDQGLGFIFNFLKRYHMHSVVGLVQRIFMFLMSLVAGLDPSQSTTSRHP